MVLDKYNIREQLGSGASGIVYLAEHKILKEYRAIKCIKKERIINEQFYAEAKLLQSLRHPAIPLLYDIEEDEEMVYIIMEYVRGESLSHFIKNQVNISVETFLYYTIQICGVIEYLHNMKPDPILYLDLKPDHIMVLGEQVKLIDYGIAKNLRQTEKSALGTPGFAAPEQWEGRLLTVQTDIYAMGIVMDTVYQKCCRCFAGSCQFEIEEELKKIIGKCTQKQPKDRYVSVSELIKELLSVQNEPNNKRKEMSSFKIAVTGTRERVGTTHIAVSLTSYLVKKGYSCIYEEKNAHDFLRTLLERDSECSFQNGTVQKGDFKGQLSYGEAVEAEAGRKEIYVYDYGLFDFGILVSEEKPDLFISVMGGRVWENEDIKIIQKLKGLDVPVLYLFNLCGRKDAQRKRELLQLKPGFHIPYFENAFRLGKAEQILMKKILEEKPLKWEEVYVSQGKERFNFRILKKYLCFRH